MGILLKCFFCFGVVFLNRSDPHGIGSEMHPIDIFDYWGIFGVVKILLSFRSFFPLYVAIFCAEHRHKRISTAHERSELAKQSGLRLLISLVLFWRTAYWNPIVVLVINTQFLFLKYHKLQFFHKAVIASSQKTNKVFGCRSRKSINNQNTGTYLAIK